MNFLDALNTKVSDIEKPRLMPVGTYLFTVHKPFKQTNSKDGRWTTIEIPVMPKAPHEEAEDIDMDELAEYGDLKQGVNSIRFMLDNQAEGDVAVEKFLWSVRRFLLDTLKLEGDDDSTIKELLGKMVGAEFLAQIAHRSDPERGETYADVKNYAPLA